MKQLLLTQQERSYIRHYLKKEARLGIVVILILCLFVMGFLIPSPLIHLALELFGGIYEEAMSENTALVFISICILAYLLPLYLFRFLMKRNSGDLYLSLPMERKRLFYVHYLIGIGFLAAASFIILILYSFFWVMSDASASTALSTYGIGYTKDFLTYFFLHCWFIVLGCCLYTFFTFLIIRCHTLSDAISVACLYTLLPLFVYYACAAFLNNVGNEILVSVSSYIAENSGIVHFLNLMAATLSIPWQMNQWLQLISGNMFLSYTFELLLIDGIIWIFVAVGCFLGAQKAFVRIRSELSEQPTDAFITYPLLIPLFTLLLLLAAQGSSIISVATVMIALAYMLAEFFAQRRISFSWRKLLQLFILIGISNLLFFLLVQTKLFGTVKEVPQIEGIETANIEVYDYHTYQYYESTMPSNKQLKQIREYHQQLVDKLSRNHGSDEYDTSAWYYTITFRYYDSDDTVITRTYPLYEKDQEYLKQLMDEWTKQEIITPIQE